MKKFHTCWIVIACVFANATALCADEGDPVAIRLWPEGGVTIETMWNLHIGNGLTEAAKSQLPRQADFDLESLKANESMTLRRPPNKPLKVSINESDGTYNPTLNDVNISKDVSHQQEDGHDPNSYVAHILVDGVDIICLNHTGVQDVMAELSNENAQPAKATTLRLPFKFDIDITFDVVIANDPSYDEAVLSNIASVLKPRYVVVNSSISKIGDQNVTAIPHNTLAVSAAADDDKGTVTRFISLSDKPYEMSDELSELFSKKEAACEDSRETFAKLSIEQMNFQPPNGTHTPRWNSEHMMGRELLFFSQIYHAVDPTIPVMDLNPRQMPDDYKMAHPDWTGAEEARQTERVEAFARRFAYLLDGMPLNRKAKGSKFWTPKALLKQMERHYNEHTANVEKKMQLDEWPKQ